MNVPVILVETEVHAGILLMDITAYVHLGLKALIARQVNIILHKQRDVHAFVNVEYLHFYVLSLMYIYIRAPAMNLKGVHCL